MISPKLGSYVHSFYDAMLKFWGDSIVVYEILCVGVRKMRKDENRVKDNEEFASRANLPSFRIPLHRGCDREELDDAEEASEGSNREASGVFLQQRGLQNEPARPTHAAKNEANATERPILLATRPMA